MTYFFMNFHKSITFSSYTESAGSAFLNIEYRGKSKHGLSSSSTNYSVSESLSESSLSEPENLLSLSIFVYIFIPLR